jgi:hypothetical protein
MPMRVGLCAAPVAAPDLALGELKAASFQALACHVPRWIAPGRQRALARPRMLLSVDMRDVDPAQPLPPGSAEFVVQDTTRVAGLGVWVALDLAPGIRLSTRSGTHWGSVMLPIEPLPAGPGRLRFDVTWNPQGQRWGVVFEGRDGSHWSARYAPPFALGSLVLARRT